MPDARSTALKVLNKVERDGAYSNIELSSALSQSGLDGRDSAFCSALVRGVLERRVTLDYIISRHSSVKIKKIAPVVLDILRMGVYQLFFMDKVPENAAVFESVELAKKYAKRSSGFINGVLRGIIRDENAFVLPDGDGIESLCIRYSVSPSLARLLGSAYGDDAEKFLEASFGKPPLDIRVNTLKTSADELAASFINSGIKAIRCDNLSDMLILETSGAPDVLPGFNEGLFHVQDKASQLCCLALSPKPGERVLDICAAPGGKSFTLAEMMKDEGTIVSCDIHSHRTALIRSGAKRLGINCIQATVNDATVGNPQLGEFDKVLCDVPCSGFGVIRRKPEIRYKNADELSDLYSLQRTILKKTSERVKKGGILVYSTCTLNPAENQDAVNEFLSENRTFEPVPLFGEGECMKTFFTHIDGTDGFFAAKLMRKE